MRQLIINVTDRALQIRTKSQRETVHSVVQER